MNDDRLRSRSLRETPDVLQKAALLTCVQVEVLNIYSATASDARWSFDEYRGQFSGSSQEKWAQWVKKYSKCSNYISCCVCHH